MASRSIKVTGFTRFLLVMLIVAPLAYIGASYYNGEDGIVNLKRLLNIGEKQETVQENPDTSPEAKPVNHSLSAKASGNENGNIQEEFNEIKKRVDELSVESEALKRKLENLEKRIGERQEK